MRGTLINHWLVLALKTVRVGVAQLYQKGYYHSFLSVRFMRTWTRTDLAILCVCVCLKNTNAYRQMTWGDTGEVVLSIPHSGTQESANVIDRINVQKGRKA